MVLAPAGLNAVLTGQSLSSSDARAARILTEWEKFYPVMKDERSNGFIPCLVEVIHCDNKMLHPSCLVGVPVQRQGRCIRPFSCVVYVIFFSVSKTINVICSHFPSCLAMSTDHLVTSPCILLYSQLFQIAKEAHPPPPPN